MTRQPVFTSQVPAGCEMYNSPKVGQDVASIMPSFIQSNTEPAPPSGIEYSALVILSEWKKKQSLKNRNLIWQ